MKATGMIRQVDELGRIVIPKEIRRTMDINERDPLEIFTDRNQIILQKYVNACVFCGNAEDLVSFNDKRICPSCLAKLKALN